jgi:hypothetical protein
MRRNAMKAAVSCAIVSAVAVGACVDPQRRNEPTDEASADVITGGNGCSWSTSYTPHYNANLGLRDGVTIHVTNNCQGYQFRAVTECVDAIANGDVVPRWDLGPAVSSGSSFAGVCGDDLFEWYGGSSEQINRHDGKGWLDLNLGASGH